MLKTKMKGITMSIVVFRKESTLKTQSMAEQMVRNMQGGLHFLGIKNIELVAVAADHGFTIDFEIPEKNVRRFLFLVHYAGIGRPLNCSLLAIYPKEGGADLRASTKEEEALADLEQRLRTPTQAEDAGLTIGI